MSRMLALSVLDLSFVTSGTPPSMALRNSLDLAPLADRLGYTRYWFAEHHNLPSVASSAPEVLIGHVASATPRIRVGAGGMMLPNHAPLRVAEAFHTLEALHPGRIDLGLGRAPGTDPATSQAPRPRRPRSPATARASARPRPSHSRTPSSEWRWCAARATRRRRSTRRRWS